jgi:hypothetical protein
MSNPPFSGSPIESPSDDPRKKLHELRRQIQLELATAVHEAAQRIRRAVSGQQPFTSDVELRAIRVVLDAAATVLDPRAVPDVKTTANLRASDHGFHPDATQEERDALLRLLIHPNPQPANPNQR